MASCTPESPATSAENTIDPRGEPSHSPDQDRLKFPATAPYHRTRDDQAAANKNSLPFMTKGKAVRVSD